MHRSTVPLALSIRCPGELGDELPAIEQLKERLWRKEDCSIETVGWVHGFVVRLRESCLEKVNALLAEHDCVVVDAWEEHYEWPTSQRDAPQQWRLTEPWNVPGTTLPEVSVPQPNPIEQATVVTPSSLEPVIIPYPTAA